MAEFDAPLEDITAEDYLAAMVDPASQDKTSMSDMIAPEVAPLTRYFGITTPSSQDLSALREIVDFFPDATGPGDLLACVRKVQRELAQPNVGESPLHHVVTYLRVLRSAQDAQAEANAYKR